MNTKILRGVPVGGLQIVLGSLLALSCLALRSSSGDTLFAAASLKNQVDDAAKAYEANGDNSHQLCGLLRLGQAD